LEPFPALAKLPKQLGVSEFVAELCFEFGGRFLDFFGVTWCSVL
jgi:hypothetical protein